MAGRAGIGDFVFFGGCGSDEVECVGAYENAGNRDFNFRHMAGDALASGRAGFVMRVLLD